MKTRKEIEQQGLEKDILDMIRIMDSQNPSKNRLEYWITHYCDGNYPKHTESGGKWLINCEKGEVDVIWEKIKEALDSGKLGGMVKVSTVRQDAKYKNHVVCVYTYDSEDTKDLLKIRENLREVGFEKPIAYKRDIETIKNVYGTEDEFFMVV